MRVNIDSQALTDPRIKSLGMRLARPWLDALGRLIPIWMTCYDRRNPIIRARDVDILAEIDGFCAAMIAEELADDGTTMDNPEDFELEDGYVRIRGVSERIRFLESQAAKGRVSGDVRRVKTKRATPRQTSFGNVVSIVPNESRTSVREPVQGAVRTEFAAGSTSGSTGDRTYSLAPDLSPDLAPDQDHPPTPRVVHSNLEVIHTPVISSLELGVPSSHDQPAIVPPRASQGPSGARQQKKQKPPPPTEALTSAFLLVEYVVKNHPTSKLGSASERDREDRAEDWADQIRLMHQSDKIAYPEIEAMIHWSQRHEFWQTVILSAGNLRAKWDAMVAQRRRASNRTPPPQQRNVIRELGAHVDRMNALEDESA